jgi:hypothetical protein
MKRRTKQGWRSNQERIKRRLSDNAPPASPVRFIDPTSVNVTAPNKPFVIQPGWTEIAVDDAFWRVWKANSLRMRQDGYRLYKIDGRWRAFYVKPRVA